MSPPVVQNWYLKQFYLHFAFPTNTFPKVRQTRANRRGYIISMLLDILGSACSITSYISPYRFCRRCSPRAPQSWRSCWAHSPAGDTPVWAPAESYRSRCCCCSWFPVSARQSTALRSTLPPKTTPAPKYHWLQKTNIKNTFPSIKI